MRNLLCAGFFRLRRNQVFWICTAAMLVFSAGMMVVWCQEDAAKGFVRDLDTFYFRPSLGVGLVYSVFSCLFLSVEHSEGTIRNKLVVGHARRDVYLSNLLTVFAASLCMALAWLVGGCAGIPFLGFLKLPPAGIALCIAVIIGFTASFSAIFTFIGMLNNRRSATVITLLVWLALLLGTSTIDNALYEPEFSNSLVLTAEGTQVLGDLEPNPNYISGIQREIYEFITDFLPTGQAGHLPNAAHPVRMLLSSLFITISTTAGGIFLFRGKNLK